MARRVRPFSKAIDSVKGGIKHTWNSTQRLKNLYRTPCKTLEKLQRYFQGIDYKYGDNFAIISERRFTLPNKGKGILLFDDPDTKGVYRRYKRPTTIDEWAWVFDQEGIKLYWSPFIQRSVFGTLNRQ